MEVKSLHYHGETVVTRGPWHMDIPLDFHLFISANADQSLSGEAAMCIAQFISRNVVETREEECSIEENDYED